MLARSGATVTGTAYFYFNVFLSPLDQLFPRWAMSVSQRLERLRHGRLKWLGAGFVLRAKAEGHTGSEECRKR